MYVQYAVLTDDPTYCSPFFSSIDGAREWAAKELMGHQLDRYYIVESIEYTENQWTYDLSPTTVKLQYF